MVLKGFGRTPDIEILLKIRRNDWGEQTLHFEFKSPNAEIKGDASIVSNEAKFERGYSELEIVAKAFLAVYEGGKQIGDDLQES